MGDLFRGKFLAGLKAARASGKLTLPASLGDDPEAFDNLVDRLFRDPRKAPTPRERGRRRRAGWVVYCKRPFGGPQQVLRYLGLYTHRVGISNQRLVRMDDQGVTFGTKDGKTMTLPPERFLERFLQHVLPSGFTKIRHFGLMAASNATTKLELARQRLSPTTPTDMPDASTANDSATLDDDQADGGYAAILLEVTGVDARICPACGLRTLRPQPLPDALARAPPAAA
jgi:hypothetical protein